jgi:hypothetical protein
MKTQQVIVIGALVIASVTAVGYATLSLLNSRRSHAEQDRRSRVGAELTRLGLSRTCARTTECTCPDVSSEVFQSCRIVAGRVALSIPSVNPCFTQWMAVDTVWASTPSPLYLGPYWVSQYPQSIAPGWSLLAVAPCLD